VPFISEIEWIRIALTSCGCFGYAFFGYPVIAALVDSVILRVLADQKDLYGRQKIGVPIGFASSVFLTGLLTEKLETLYALFIVFTVYNLAFVITVAVTDLEPHYRQLEEQDDDTFTYGSMSPTTASVTIEDDDDNISVTKKEDISMWLLLQEAEVIQFFTFMTMMGFSFAVAQAFLYLFFENDLHGTSAMVGLFGPLGSSTEVVCFFFSKEVCLNAVQAFFIGFFYTYALQRFYIV
jgi:hypothetical protein